MCSAEKNAWQCATRGIPVYIPGVKSQLTLGCVGKKMTKNLLKK